MSAESDAADVFIATVRSLAASAGCKTVDLTKDFILNVLANESLEPGGFLKTDPDSKIAPDTNTCSASPVGAIVRRVLAPQENYRERIQAVAAGNVASAVDSKDPRWLSDPGEWDLPIEEIHRRALLAVVEEPLRALSWAYDSLARGYGKQLSELSAEDLTEMRALAIEFVRDSFPAVVKLKIPDSYVVSK